MIDCIIPKPWQFSLVYFKVHVILQSPVELGELTLSAHFVRLQTPLPAGKPQEQGRLHANHGRTYSNWKLQSTWLPASIYFFLFPKSVCTSLLWEKYSFDLERERGFFFCNIIDFHLENTSLAQHVGFKYVCRNTKILRAVDYASHPLECLFPLLPFLSQ